MKKDHQILVMIVDDDPEVVSALHQIGEHHFFNVVSASNVSTALDLLEKQVPDVVLIDMDLGSAESGLLLAAQLRANPNFESIPIGFISGDSSYASRVNASKAGAATYLVKPVASDQLAAAIHRLIAKSSDTSPRLLILASESAQLPGVSTSLADAGIGVEYCLCGEELPDRLSEVRPDILLIDAEAPPSGGLDACRLVRSMPRWHDLHIVLMTRALTPETIIEAREAGIDEWLVQPLAANELVDKALAYIGRLNRMRARFDRDPLTGLSLRRTFLDEAGAQFNESTKRGNLFSLAMVDLDHFKRINDTHGHHVGDAILSRFGQLLHTRLRKQDLRSRWGGEEFCLAFACESALAVGSYLDRLQFDLRNQRLIGKRGESITVSFSAGVASAPADGETMDMLLRCADERLYAAKRNGRGRVIWQ